MALRDVGAILLLTAVAGCSNAPTSDSKFAPTSDSKLAPTSDSRFAPASDSKLAPTSDSKLAPTSDSEPAPTSGSQTTAAASSTFDSSRAWEHLRRQVAFGPRPAGSGALADCRRYLLGELKAAGIAAREQPFEATTPIGKLPMVNIVATIPGRRPERIVIGSHYDTKLYREFRFVGATDGASSTAALLELGRVLKARQKDYTIELLFFDGEEAVIDWVGTDHTYGSRYYVQNAKTSGTLAGIKAFVLLDMIGDRDLTIRRDTDSTRWLNDIIWASAARLGYQRYFLAESFTLGGDDHFEFLAAGVPSIDIIDFDDVTWHTAQDTLDHVSARSLQIVGDVVLDAIPQIERRIASGR